VSTEGLCNFFHGRFAHVVRELGKDIQGGSATLFTVLEPNSRQPQADAVANLIALRLAIQGLGKPID
jgi:hypothetical protein